jgi:2Fe-2S ferredoxin
VKVKFVPQNIELEIKPGQTVMGVAHENGVVIRSTCNGMPSCAECRVKVVDGDWNINPPSRKELSLIGTGYYIDQRRLSCQMLCFGDVTVDTTEQIEKSAEGPVTKKFLTKVHKATAAESFSLGGVLIEQDEKLLKEVELSVQQQADRPQGRENQGGGGNRDRRPRGGGGGRDRGGNRGGQQAHGLGQGQDGHDPSAQIQGGEGGPRPEGGGQRRGRGRGRGRGGRR